MDIDKLIKRIKSILTSPKTEWPVIAGEPATVSDLYKNYIMILAAIPAVVGFIKGSLIGYSVYGMSVRAPIGSGLVGMVLGYALSLVSIYVVALVIDALAPTFGAQKNQTQALKSVAYAWTASWVIGLGMIIPEIGMLFLLAGLVYSIYLLYLGLPATMKCPPEKAAGYTALSIICAIVLNLIIGAVVQGIVGGAVSTLTVNG